MPAPALTDLVAGGLVLGGLIVVLLLKRRPDQTRLRLVARNAWMLHHLCRASGRILRAVPAVEHLAIDLTRVPDLDLSTLALLDHTCRKWTEAGAGVVIDGCTGHVAQMIRSHELTADLRRGPPGADLAAPRPPLN